MIRKITVNIMAVILTAGMFLGTAGVVIPEPVHAEDEGYWVFDLIIEYFKDGDDDLTGDIKSTDLTVRIGGAEFEGKENGRKVTLSNLSGRPDSFSFAITSKSPGGYNPETKDVKTDGGNEGAGYDTGLFGAYEWKYYYKMTHYHNDHKWTYAADGNVITAKCESPWECPLETPTLTLDAGDKTYDGKPVTATLSPNGTWKTNNGLPEINEGNITYSPDNSKNAGTYTVSYTLDGATATKQFTIKKRPVIVGGIRIKDKDYDGNMKATADTSEAKIIGLVSGDDLKVKVTGEFEDAEPGENKTVYLTYKLSGADAGNYYVADSPFSPKTGKADINPMILGKGGVEADEGSSSGNGKAANSSKRSPDTGDTNDITGLLAMMLTSAAALGAMGFRRIRENRK